MSDKPNQILNSIHNPSLIAGFLIAVLLSGCSDPSITAVNLNDSQAPEGIPYYLPKPYLVISKNVRYIPTPSVGLTETVSIPNSFDSSGNPWVGNGKTSTPNTSTSTGNGGPSTGTDNSSKPTTGTNPPTTTTQVTIGNVTNPGTSSADPNATTSTQTQPKDTSKGSTPPSTQVSGPASIAVIPAASIKDGLTPEEFYTWQIVYLPDLTQKYGLRVRGGDGEMRATINLVNGWMHTGPGPVYFRNSTTAENLAGAASTITSVGGLADSAANFVSTLHGMPSVKPISTTKGGTTTQGFVIGQDGKSTLPTISKYAQIWIYEPVLVPDKSVMGGQKVVWRLMTGSEPLSMDREVFGTENDNTGAGDGAQDDMPPQDGNPTLTDTANKEITNLKLQVKATDSFLNADKIWLVDLDKSLSDDDTLKLKNAIEADIPKDPALEKSLKNLPIDIEK